MLNKSCWECFPSAPMTNMLPHAIFAFIYVVRTESFSKRLVGPWTRRLYQPTNLLSLVPSVSWFSWTEEFPLILFLRFTFAVVAGVCPLICLISHHSSVLITTDLTWCWEREGSRSEAQESQLQGVIVVVLLLPHTDSIYLPYQQEKKCNFSGSFPLFFILVPF